MSQTKQKDMRGKRRVSVARPTRPRRKRIPLVTPTALGTPVAKALPAAVQKIVETLHPEKIILFGSYAYGTPTPDSDVDLLVIMRTKASWKEWYLAVARVLAQNNFFIREIYTQGRILYER